MQKQWYAVYTRPKAEKKLMGTLTRKKIQHYCPMNRQHVQSIFDKHKLVAEPLFPNYVFVKIAESEFSMIRSISDVINLLFWIDRPVVIKDVEIENLKDFVENYNNIILEKIPVSLKNMVRITSKTPSRIANENVVIMQSNIVKLTLPSMGYVICASSNDEVYEKEKINLGVKNLVS
jgi:transcription antitermination factor NusG